MNESDTFSACTVVQLINDDTQLPDLNPLLRIPQAHARLRARRLLP